MLIMGWFNKFNSRGEIVSDGKSWLTDDAIVTRRHNDTETIIQDRVTGSVLHVIPRGFNRIQAGGGRWIGERSDAETLFLYEGERLMRIYTSAGGHVARDGSRVATVQPWNPSDNIRTLATIDGIEIARGPVMDVSLARSACAYIWATGIHSRAVKVFWFDTSTTVDCSVSDAEGSPVLIESPAGLWLLTTRQEVSPTQLPYLFVRPVGQTNNDPFGYVRRGVYHGPDAIWRNDRIEIISNDNTGQSENPNQHFTINPADTRIDLRTVVRPDDPVDPDDPDDPDEPEEPMPAPILPNYLSHIQKRWEEGHGGTTEAAAARFLRIVAYDIHYGHAGAVADPRVGIWRKDNPFGHDPDKLTFRFPEGIYMVDIIVDAGVPSARPAWQNDPSHYWFPTPPHDPSGWFVPEATPGVHDDPGTPRPICNIAYPAGSTGDCLICGHPKAVHTVIGNSDALAQLRADVTAIRSDVDVHEARWEAFDETTLPEMRRRLDAIETRLTQLEAGGGGGAAVPADILALFPQIRQLFQLLDPKGEGFSTSRASFFPHAHLLKLPKLE
jgi:hypothetical protein